MLVISMIIAIVVGRTVPTTSPFYIDPYPYSVKLMEVILILVTKTVPPKQHFYRDSTMYDLDDLLAGFKAIMKWNKEHGEGENNSEIIIIEMEEVDPVQRIIDETYEEVMNMPCSKLGVAPSSISLDALEKACEDFQNFTFLSNGCLGNSAL